MPQMKSQHWLFGTLGGISLASVFYTAFIGDIGLNPLPERKVESQHTIDDLSADMKRFISSIASWKSFCEDPYAYIDSATVHGNFTITLAESPGLEGQETMSQITRDALTRCERDRKQTHQGQVRLCLSLKESGTQSDALVWFDDTHIFEMSFEFRKRGAKLVTSCEELTRERVEVQTYFSAYTDRGPKQKAGRVSGGLRMPLESARL